VNPYSVFVAIGIGLGLFQVCSSAPEFLLEKRLRAAILVLLGVLVGARMGFIVFHRAYYAAHLLEIPQVWLGGLSWAGGAIGGLFTLVGVARLRGIRLGNLADDLAPLIAPLAVCTWLGAWMAGSGYGPVLSDGSWWGIPAADIAGKVVNRWPVQPAAAFSLLAAFALLERFVPRKGRSGRYFCLVGLILSFHLLLFSFLVADPAPLWRGLRQDTWSALVLALFFSGALAWNAAAKNWKG
jgi:prolipoprotein diacylglyceryltransferase